MIRSKPLAASHGSAPAGFFSRFAHARSATVSLVLHTAALALIGGIVLYPSQPKPPEFEFYEGVSVPAIEAEPPPISEKRPETISLPKAAAGGLESASMTQVTTAAFNDSFKITDTINVLRMAESINGRGVLPTFSNNKGPGPFPGRGPNPFGAPIAQGGVPRGLAGHFYDLKQTDRRKDSGVGPGEYLDLYRRFVRENWNPSILKEYFRAPQTLYTTQIMIPNMDAEEGPRAFDVEKDVKPRCWLVHYKGRVSPPEDGTYRFVGAGDDVLIVRFNGKVVLDRSGWTGQPSPFFTAARNYHYGFTGIPNGFAVGDALNVKAGQFYDLEVLIGEQPGGKFFACLLMEKEGGQYDLDGHGNPLLPIFRVADTPMPELQAGQELPRYAENGPIWRAAPIALPARP